MGTAPASQLATAAMPAAQSPSRARAQGAYVVCAQDEAAVFFRAELTAALRDVRFELIEIEGDAAFLSRDADGLDGPATFATLG